MIENIFVAMDFSKYDDFLERYNMIRNDFQCFKVGYELFYSDGQRVLEKLNKDNKTIFLDLKFHDIGNTMKKAFLKLIENNKFHFLTVFLENNENDLRELTKLAHDNGVKLLGVTLLTNIDKTDVKALYGHIDSYKIIQKRVDFAEKVGFDGLILSPLDIPKLNTPNNLIRVTPGIRYEDEGKDDQRRRATPKQAFELGADFLVMGRSIFKFGKEKLLRSL
ncbi:orotidine-5'-phosphate decarboxylase [bacterium]|nr:orotidine-5'-phosphate decarboxylase [bacterium]